MGEVLEPRVLFDERELDDTGGAVALLADDDLRDPFGRLVRLAVVVAVLLLAEDEEDDVGILLERARLAKIGELRPVVRSCLGRA